MFYWKTLKSGNSDYLIEKTLWINSVIFSNFKCKPLTAFLIVCWLLSALFYLTIKTAKQTNKKIESYVLNIHKTLFVKPQQRQTADGWIGKRTAHKTSFPNDRVLSDGFWFSVEFGTCFSETILKCLSINDSQNNRLVFIGFLVSL